MPSSAIPAAMPNPPLAGLRVLVTRPEGDGAREWAAALAEAGAVPVPYPTLAVAAPDSPEALEHALARFSTYDWVVFTSQTTVARVLEHFPDRRFPPAPGPKLAAVGPATARAVASGGGVVALLPDDPRQEGLVEALAFLAPGSRVLLPIAKGGRPLLAERLRSRGCQLEVVIAYQTLPRSPLSPPPGFDVATFASPSALRAYLGVAGAPSLGGKHVVVIGPTTAAAADASGLAVVVAAAPDIASVISAIAKIHRSQGAP